MHLRLSDQELATLVEMVSLAANVASWNQKETANDQVSAFENLESKILEKAGHSGLGDWIEFDEETQRFRVKAGTSSPCGSLIATLHGPSASRNGKNSARKTVVPAPSRGKNATGKNSPSAASSA
jgi:hypothetical protein